MPSQKDITLRSGDASPKDVVLYELPIADVTAVTIYLTEFDATPNNVVLRDPTVQPQAVGPATITGTLAATDGPDTASFVGTIAHVGTLAVTESADTAAFSGLIDHIGTLAATDGIDTASFPGLISHRGTLAATDGSDTLAMAGSIGHVGILDVTDDADTFASVGLINHVGNLIAADGSDTAEWIADVAPGSKGGLGYGLLLGNQPFNTFFLGKPPEKHKEEIREVYEELIEIAPAAIKKEAGKVVRPFNEGDKRKSIPIPSKVDWTAFERDHVRVAVMLELWQELIIQEEEDILLLLAA